MKFKEFGDWIEIFKGGKQFDSNGREHDGDGLIETAVSSFDPGAHEPPIVLGHPKENAPAYGWVEGLKTVTRNGAKVLLAKFKEVEPEFEKLVKGGRFKNDPPLSTPTGACVTWVFLGQSRLP